MYHCLRLFRELLLTGDICRYVNNMRQFLKLLQAVQYFTCRDWKIDNHNVKELMSKLNSTDKKVLQFHDNYIRMADYLVYGCSDCCLRMLVSGAALSATQMFCVFDMEAQLTPSSPQSGHLRAWTTNYYIM